MTIKTKELTQAGCRPAAPYHDPTEPALPKPCLCFRMGLNPTRTTGLDAFEDSPRMPKSRPRSSQHSAFGLTVLSFRIGSSCSSFHLVLVHRAQRKLEKVTVCSSCQPSPPWAHTQGNGAGSQARFQRVPTEYRVAGSFVSEESPSLKAQGFLCR